ncbi:MAG: elongation factor G [Oligoflexia bacterium]|nr:elongation factor G [Oligoflexia bacterium]
MALKVYPPEMIRNVALVGHGHSGKTSLAESMLFSTGATSRLGKTVDGTSILDFEPEEQKRGGSIASSVAWLEHDGHKINILDTPGDQNFLYDALAALRGADAAVVVVSAPDGVEVGTERLFSAARNLGLPTIIFINKMDRDRADAQVCLAEIEEVLGVTPIPLQLPWGEESGFKGIISLLQHKAFAYRGDDSGGYDKVDIPDDQAERVEEAMEALIDAVASTDDDLLETYLETFELSDEDLRAGLHTALKTGKIVPVLFGAAASNIGASSLLDLIAWACPCPLDRSAVALADQDLLEPVVDGPFVAQVIHTLVDEFSGKLSIFRVLRGDLSGSPVVLNTHSREPERMGAVYALRGKDRETVAQVVTGDILGMAKLKSTHTGDTLADNDNPVVVEPLEYPPPMMSYTITPKTKTDADRIKTALERLLDEDPTLTVSTDSLSSALVLNGMGQAHLEMAIERMARKYKVKVEIGLVPVPYRETLKAAVQHVEGKHKKQTGGAGQFGVAFMNFIPQERDAGFEFVNKIKGGSIPNQFIPSVEKGLRERMKSGFLAGYPVVDLKVELVDGKYHPVDSKDVAFQLAGSKGMKVAFQKGGTVLLEPIMGLEIVVPTDVMGDVMGDVTSRRGRVLGMVPRGKNTIIQALAPQAELLRFAPDLKGMTGGKGAFTMELSGYEQVPAHMVEKIVAASPFKHEDDE